MAFLNKLFGKKKNNEENIQDITSETDNMTEESEDLTEEEIAAAEAFERALEAKSFETDDETCLQISEEMLMNTFDAEDAYDSAENNAYDDAESNAEDSVGVDTESDEIEAHDTNETDGEDVQEKVSFWQKLKNGLSKTKNALFGSIDDLLKKFVKVDEDLLDELEELLIMADVGVTSTEYIIDELRDRIKDGRLKEKEQVMSSIQEIIKEMIGENEPLRLDTTPSVILVIGVNGAGKTTSIGKISKRLRASGKKVVVAAADTFRAAAIEQLEVWCQRAGVDMVRQNEGSDPAAVVFDAISYAKKKQADVLIIDTAGRLHNKTNLMNELAKINRVIDRELPGVSRENLLVLDATTGQNAVLQAKEFSRAASITGITLNKLDGTAKGGIVISIRQELGIPVKFIGVGEKIDDMREFDAHDFVVALFE